MRIGQMEEGFAKVHVSGIVKTRIRIVTWKAGTMTGKVRELCEVIKGEGKIIVRMRRYISLIPQIEKT